jgi:hypothetical protein
MIREILGATHLEHLNPQLIPARHRHAIHIPRQFPGAIQPRLPNARDAQQSPLRECLHHRRDLRSDFPSKTRTPATILIRSGEESRRIDVIDKIGTGSVE